MKLFMPLSSSHLSPNFNLSIRRLFLLIGGLGILVFSHLADMAHQAEPRWLDWDRYLTAGLYLGHFLLSFTHLVQRRWFRTWLDLLMLFAYPTEIAYVLAVEQFNLYYLVGWLLTIQLTMLMLWRPRELWAFVGYQVVLTGLVMALAEPMLTEAVFVGLSLIIILWANVINQRLHRRNQLQLARQQEQAERDRSTMRSLIDSSSDLIWAVDADYRIQQCNPAFQQVVQKVHGLTLGVGDSLRQLPTDAEESMRFGHYYRFALTGKSIELEHGLPIAGRYRWYALAFNPIWDSQGDVLGVSVFARDISERKRMEEALQTSESRYLNALASAGDGVWEWDLDHDRVHCSPHLLEMMQLPAEATLRAADWETMIVPEDRSLVRQAVEAHLRGETERLAGEFRLMRPDGRIHWMQGKGSAMRDSQGRATRLYGAISDVTERKQSDLLLQNILENSVSGILAMRAVRNADEQIVDFAYTLANPAAAEVVGHPIDQIVGQRMHRLMPGHFANGLFDRYVQVVEQQQPTVFEAHYGPQGLDPSWFHIVAFPLQDGLSVTFTDITERYRTQERLHLLSLVAQKTGSAVIITDRQGQIEWVNEAFTEVSGYSLDEVKGMIPGNLLQGPDTDPETVRRIAQHLREQQAVEAEVLNYRKDGSIYWIAMHITPVFNDQGELQRFVAIENDITERKAAEQALREAKEAAEAAARAKSDFLATMSHEIRTPMNAVIGMTGLLLDTELDEEQREFVETIRISGDNLLTVINDILDFSKIDAGRLELEAQPFNLIDTIEDVLDLLSTKAREKGLELAYDLAPEVPIHVKSDPTRLSQILVNLIGNGIKFTEQGEVTVSVQTNEPPSEGQSLELQFEVRDTGIGIPAEKINRLFQPFSQVDASTTRKYGGTGLGLAICRMLVNLMGGRIWIESQMGQGTSFFFTLQVAAEADPETAPRALTPPDLADVGVLLVDDNRTNLTILARQCERWGMRPVCFQRPADALAWLQQPSQAIELAIIDGMMPEISGRELATRLRAEPHTAALPIILLTSMGDGPHSRQASHLFDASLSKPVRRHQLQKHILRVLGRCEGHAPAVPKAPPSEPADPAMPPLRILLAEDNAVNQKVALRMLSKLGYQADVAANGLEALKALELTRYDLVFMDMQMPEMDGLAATSEILARYPERSQRPLIIAMTANALKGDRERCLAAGMDDYVSKPVKLPHLREVISRWFVAHSQAPSTV